jgi:hypothetical protein
VLIISHMIWCIVMHNKFEMKFSQRRNLIALFLSARQTVSHVPSFLIPTLVSHVTHHYHFYLFICLPSDVKQILCHHGIADGGEASRYEGVTKSFRTGRLERGLQMVQLSTSRCSCIAIL